MSTPETSAILVKLREAIQSGEIGTAELEALLERSPAAHSRFIQLLPALGILGAVICFGGLSVLLGQHWNEFGSLMRIALTLGSGLIAYVVAMILFLDEDSRAFSPILCIFAILLLPSGLGVALHEAGYHLELNSTQLFMAFLLFVTFAAPALVLKSNAMLVAAIWSLTALFFISTNMLVDGMHVTSSFHEYRAFITGIFYIALGVALRENEFRISTGALYFMGSAVALIAGFCLMGWKPTQDILWELVYPGVAMASIYAGVELRSRALMINGALALNGYIIKISAQYFATSLGWPLSMICAGIGIIAVALYSMGLYREQPSLAADRAR